MNIADAVARWAEETPYAVAIIEDGRVIDFRTLDAAIWRAAAWLRAQGLAPGDVVALSLHPNSALFLTLVYALGRMGAVQMVLRLREPASWRLTMARRYGAVAVLGDDASAQLEGLPLLAPDPAWLAPGRAAPVRGSGFAGGEAPWALFFSSGTTGAPKAILRSHRDQILISETGRISRRGGPKDRFLTLASLGFAYGLINAMVILDGGGTVRVVPLDIGIEQVFTIIDREGINRVVLTATHAAWLLAHCPDDRPRFPRIRILTISTMHLPDTLRREVRRRLTPNLIVTYGTTEAWYGTRAEPAVQIAHPETVGFPYDGVVIEIVDEAGKRLPPGEVGEVRLRGAGLPAGYVDNPEATARAFRDGWFHPGDLGCLSPEGALFLKGRVDDLMNHEGTKIFPADIEAELMRHPAVAEAAAFPLRRADKGDVPVAAVVLRGAATAEELLAFCRAALGPRAPSRIVIRPGLPRNAMGKILKSALAASLAE